MLVHIVVWRLLKNETAQAERVRSLIMPLAGLVPGMLEIHVGINAIPGDCSADVLLYSEFDSEASLRAYQMHPQHVSVAREVAKLVSDRRVIDYYH